MKTKMLKKQARIQALSDVPTSELIEELWGRSDVIGAQIWRTGWAVLESAVESAIEKVLR